MTNPPTAAVAQSVVTTPKSAPVASTWVEVSVNALRHNLRTIQAHVGPEVIVCPVIKSDAYGHGTLGCAQALRDGGAKWLAVSVVEEGIALRQQGIDERILVLSGFGQNEPTEIVRNRLTPTVWEQPQLDSLEK